MQSTGEGLGRRKKAILVILVLGLASAIGVLAGDVMTQRGASAPSAAPQSAQQQGVGSFKNYSELQNFIMANAKSAQQYGNSGGPFFGGIVNGGNLPVTMATQAVFAASATLNPTSQVVSTPSYSGTNVQVQGVDEPDIVKTDGTHLFVSTASAVTIINAYPPGSASVLSTTKLPNGEIQGIEISQNRLLIINQRYSNTTYADILLYNTTVPSSPNLIQNVSVSGNYIASRLVDGYFYAIIQQPSYSFDNGSATGMMPLVTSNGETTTLQPSSVYYTPINAQINYYTMVVSVSMSGGTENTISVLTGPSSTVYVSTKNIYVVYAIYQQYYADNIPGDVFSGGVISAPAQGGQNSTIFRASYSNGSVTVEAAGTIPGTILNQFSLNEYNGHFMVATSRNAEINGAYTISDDVYVLNMSMSQISAVRNIAPGENIYAVSFVGDMGYVVTFEQVDPLFAISFQDASHPVVLSALKVNGYSDYLFPLPDGYLVGVGKDTVQSSTGNFSYYLGLKLSLFKVFPNGSSSDVSNYLIGDRGTDSPVLTNHLAFTYDSTDSVMVIPVLLAQVNANQNSVPDGIPPFGNYVWQGAYVFNVTTTGFNMLGRVTQYPVGQGYGDSPNTTLQIERSVIIGDYLYTISPSEVMVSNMSTFDTVSSIPLATS